ncbi:MAG: dUTP diphosphatase [Phycisphaerales bacterium]|nr:dUTP diphosphatase [Phycisphaerales bacterium]MCI0630374.1 dUTP diphosphatase [Phycisphaerales bacterium]MCI0676640.1 dUTP diphosphatase [Phycisphaerales bacterium]
MTASAFGMEIKGPVDLQPLRIKRLSKLATLPCYHSEHAAGMDLHAAIDDPLTIPPSEIRLIPCGFALAVPPGYEAQVRPRSGLASKHAISMPNSPGTIDADYRGEVKVPLINLGRQAFTVEPDMRIAQMVIAPVARCRLEQVEELDQTGRGAGGFGSTGI